MPTSSTVWCASTRKSPCAATSRSIRPWRDSRSSMWSKKPTPVWTDAAPRPSRLSESSTFVSLVCRTSFALRSKGGAIRVRSSCLRGQRLNAGEQGVVLLALADGDADLVGQPRLVPIADEDPLLLEPEVDVSAPAVGRGGEDEVGLALGHRPAQLRQLRREALPLGLHE